MRLAEEDDEGSDSSWSEQCSDSNESASKSIELESTQSKSKCESI